ncbi:Mediator of RNA polymerase II transcription subunit 10 [Physocladia obscura]|uniref:Mediator of RNA polymerase II transcription subunit 10 n=1 Tax=Physocladia obscura TaxID=109957 RepID=A0AAD5SSR0_9FUNG|nr:Mediator of RNA polymerase II transcription subunit 10 [Physocladia obscura]
MGDESQINALALASLEKSVMATIASLHKIGVSAFDYQPDRASVLHGRINTLVKNMKDVETASQNVNTNIPINAIEFVDQGGNPDVFTQQIAQVLVDKNQKSNGIVASVKFANNKKEQSYNNILADEIRKNYPDLYNEYTRANNKNEAS